jgi:hypothetical protein
LLIETKEKEFAQVSGLGRNVDALGVERPQTARRSAFISFVVRYDRDSPHRGGMWIGDAWIAGRHLGTSDE